MAFDLFLLDDFVEHKNRSTVLFPHHQPKVADGVLQRSLRQDILAIGPFHFDQIGVDIVDGAATQYNARMIVRTDIAISIESTVVGLITLD